MNKRPWDDVAATATPDKNKMMSYEELVERAVKLGIHIRNRIQLPDRRINVFGIPRGGINAVLALRAWGGDFSVTSDPNLAHVFVDDIVDTGATAERYAKLHGKQTFALVDKRQLEDRDIGWVVFPWEGTSTGSFEDNITRLIQFVGEDPTRGGLKDTPARTAQAWRFWTSGYEMDASEILKTFEDGAKGYDEMVVVSSIPVYSHCEHHLAPIFGTATVAYIPDGRIVGLSKLNRLVDMYARRLQVQERMTQEIADTLMKHLRPKGCGVTITARHLCMESRGVQHNSETTTSALLGVFRDDAQVRAEFMALRK